MSNCTHTQAKRIWVDDEWDEDEEPTISGHWEHDVVGTAVHLDLHRYKCNQCGEIMYYSGAARDYYENNIKTNITGLDK